MSDSFSDSAARQLRMSPGGMMLNSARSRPELPPSSEVATIATSRSRTSSPRSRGEEQRAQSAQHVRQAGAAADRHHPESRVVARASPAGRRRLGRARLDSIGCYRRWRRCVQPASTRARGPAARRERAATAAATGRSRPRPRSPAGPSRRRGDSPPGSRSRSTEAAGADGVERAGLCEVVERARRPVTQAACRHAAAHDLDQLGGASSPEFYDAEVLAVRVRRIHRLRDLGHAAAAHAAPSSLHRHTAPRPLHGRRGGGRSRGAPRSGRSTGPGGRGRHNLGPRTPQIAEVVPSTASTSCSSLRICGSQRR